MINTYIKETLIAEWTRLHFIKHSSPDRDIQDQLDTSLANIEGMLRYICGDETVNLMIVEGMFAGYNAQKVLYMK